MKHPNLMSTLDFNLLGFHGGHGAWLKGYDGKDYLDFFSDVGTASLGYCSEEQRAVLTRLLDPHEAIPLHQPNLFASMERDSAAGRLCQATGMERVFFCNSGTEAVEAALKVARLTQAKRYGTLCRVSIEPKRSLIASYVGGFHGRTYGGLSAGDGPAYHTWGYGPLLDGFRHFSDISEIPKDAAAVILAPVFGNNDVRVYPDGWLEQLRKHCDDNGIILIFDEVQTGSGRCGTTFTYAQNIGVQPDVITLAKGLGMGVPVGAMLARGDCAEAFTPGTHFSTFGGSPMCCAFVNGMLDWATAQQLKLVALKGRSIRTILKQLSFVQNVRGVGMLNAFDVDFCTRRYAEACFQHGILIGAFRSGPGPIKITPPLNIDMEDIFLGIQGMNDAYNDMRKAERA